MNNITIFLYICIVKRKIQIVMLSDGKITEIFCMADDFCKSINSTSVSIAQIEHSRHRSVNNFMVNAVSAIAAYCFFPKKPSISIETYSDNQLVLF